MQLNNNEDPQVSVCYLGCQAKLVAAMDFPMALNCCGDWTTVKTYKGATYPSRVCALKVCVGSVKLYSNLGQAKCVH